MKMNDYLLPDALIDDGMNDNIFILSYHTVKPSLKTKITLRYNLFIFLLEGEKSVYYADGKTEINPSKFLLLSAGNCLMSEKMASENGTYKSILLFFDNKILMDFFIKYPLSIKVSKEANRESPILCFHRDPFLNNYIDSLGLILSSGQPPETEMKKIKFEELMLYISQKYPGEILALRNTFEQANDDAVIRQAALANIENNITVEELAFLCNMSISTFKRRFAKIYNTSPSKWLLQQKMKRAATLLRQGDFKTSEVYYKLGYENLSSFIQSFKQVHGITPKQFQLSN
jgi:AraC-like DNA-binding protein